MKIMEKIRELFRMTPTDRLARRGARYLDWFDAYMGAKTPWHETIDLNKLDLSSTVKCVLGQQYGSWQQGLATLRLSLAESYRYGFSIPVPKEGKTIAQKAAIMRDEYKLLNEAWVRVILVRRYHQEMKEL